MPQVVRLNIDLVARTAKMVAGFGKAQKRLSMFKQSVTRTMKRLAIGAAAFAIALPAALAAFIRPAFKTIDTLAKVSDKLGITAQELIVLREAAARYSGMEAKTMDMALQRMGRRLSEAANNTGEAQQAIKDLGLDAKKLKKLGVAKAFEQIADAIAKEESPLDRVRLAFKFFDSEGAALATTLVRGSAAIKAMTQETKALGLTLTEIDKKAVEEVNDQMARLGSILEGVRMKLAAGVAPALAVIIGRFVDMGKEGQRSGNLISSAVDGINISLAATSQWLANVQWFMKGWKVTILEVQRAFAEMVGSRNLGRITADLKRTMDELLTLQNTDWTQKFFDDMEALRDRLRKDVGGGGLSGGGALGGAAALSAGAIQRGDPGLQRIIKQSGATKMGELVAVEKRSEAELKKHTVDLKKIADGMEAVKAWKDIGVMAF